MSASYTVHPPRGAEPGDASALDRAVLVRDAFSWGAFLAPALWFLWHRHVVLALVAALAVFGLGAGLAAAGIERGVALAAQILLHLLFGLEGASVRRLALSLRGRPACDVVLADDETAAAAKGFARWLDGGRPSPAPVGAGRPLPAWKAVGEPVIGLFPDREGRR